MKTPTPNCPPTQTMPAPRSIGLPRPLHWLRLGWRDLWRCGAVSLLHGLVLALGYAALMVIARDRFWLLAGAASGFLVIAPVLATSLYALSRALERGEAANFGLLIATWGAWQHQRRVESGGYWCLVRFGLLLALAGTGWVLTSAALITLLSPEPILKPTDFLEHVVLSDSWLFEAWLLLGGLMAAPVFASSVVSMPLLLDRRVNTLQAVLASWQVVVANPLPMATWAALILGLTALGLFTGVGLVLVIPLLGHASWHAYRDLIDASALPERTLPIAALARTKVS